VVQDFSHPSTVSLINDMCIWTNGNSSNLMTIKLDASDDRRINSVREDIKGFAEKCNVYKKYAFFAAYCSPPFFVELSPIPIYFLESCALARRCLEILFQYVKYVGHSKYLWSHGGFVSRFLLECRKMTVRPIPNTKIDCSVIKCV